MFLKPRSGREPCPVLALADDLSGAAETAAALCLPGRIVLGPATGGSAAVAPPVAGEALVIDLDTRQLDPGEAARVVRETVRDMARATVRDAGNDTVLIKKTDSLLRGNLAAEAAAYAEGAGGLVIAPALPVAGRTVCDGVVHLHGTPLHETDAWRAEAGSVPRSVAEALGDLRTEVVPLAVVRSSGRELAGRLRDLAAAGLHSVCDTETDADLDAIADAALQLGPRVRLLGTGGLACALGRLLGGRTGRSAPAARATDTPSPGVARTADRPLLVVVGTAEPTAAAQIAQLTAAGARHTVLPADLLAGSGAPDPAESDAPLPLPAGQDGVTVVSIDNTLGIQLGSARRMVTGLGRAVAALPYPTDLVLTGGETARRVLDALGITRLRPVGQIHHGAVHCHTPDGRSVVTRPGSHGDTGSLLRIARALRPDQLSVPVEPSIPAESAVPGVEFDAPAPPPPVSHVPQGEVL